MVLVIVYIFYDNFFKKVFLPIRVLGVYPIYYHDSRVLLNIEAVDGVSATKNDDGSWTLTLTNPTGALTLNVPCVLIPVPQPDGSVKLVVQWDMEAFARYSDAIAEKILNAPENGTR